MSVMEQALREIDARRHPPNAATAATAADDALALTNLPLQPPAPPGARLLPLLPLLGLLAAGALGGWAATVWWQTPADDHPAPATASAPAAPATGLAEAILLPPANPNATGLVGDEWVVQAGHLWLAGRHQDAASQWAVGLRGLPPSQLALLLADHQELSAARELHRQWAGQWPVVVLPRQGLAEQRWLLLAVPASSELERARQQLAQATQRPVVWATVAE